MRKLKLHWLFVFYLNMALGQTPPQDSVLLQGPRIHNIASDFYRIWKSNADQPLEIQAGKLRTELFPLFPQFYAYIMKSWQAEHADTNAQLQNVLKAFTPVATAFEHRTEKISHDLDSNLQNFIRVFPDLNRNFDVYVIHSFGEMDGGTRDLAGKTYFILGVDMIVKYHTRATSESPFFHHELFHLYHTQFFHPPQKIWAALWNEGLATYVSEQLNPGATYDDLLLNIPEGLVAAVEKDKAYLWKNLERKLTSGKDKDYEAYFLLSSTDKRIPVRAGYYLGYLVAKEIGKTHTLQELSRMQEKEVLPLIRATIKKLRGD